VRNIGLCPVRPAEIFSAVPPARFNLLDTQTGILCSEVRTHSVSQFDVTMHWWSASNATVVLAIYSSSPGAAPSSSAATRRIIAFFAMPILRPARRAPRAVLRAVRRSCLAAFRPARRSARATLRPVRRDLRAARRATPLVWRFALLACLFALGIIHLLSSCSSSRLLDNPTALARAML
jgi:hypothetical protein